MRTSKSFASVLVIIAAALFAQMAVAQYSISSIAGGGPNNLPALQTSIGFPESIALDAAGNAYIAQSAFSSQILKVSATGTVTVFAGNGTSGYSGDGGPAASAALSRPEGVFVDGSGNVFIADTENSVIREVVAATGNIQTVVGIQYDAAGGSACQSDGDGGPALSAHLCLPYSIFVDASGNIFIADFGNSTIREVVASTGNIQIVAGTPGTPGYKDGVPAAQSELDLPSSVFVDASGNIFIADTFNSVIRVVNPSASPVTISGVSIAAGNIQTVAGTQYDSFEGSACQTTGDGGPAISAHLCLPFSVFVDSSQNIFVADYANFAIREVVPAGTISTVAGTLGADCQTYATTGCGNGSAATTAQLNFPSGVTVNSAGDIFIADTEDSVVREVPASTGLIQAFAGNATVGFSGDGGLPTDAELNDPGAVFMDSAGNTFIADTSNSAIREIVAATGNIQTVAGTGAACPIPPTAGCGDGGLATAAQLNFPGGVFVDTAGNIFIADTANSAIREVVAATGNIQTVAGTLGSAGYSGDGGLATAAQLSNPNAVFVDAAGNIYIADTDNSAIREVVAATGIIQTVAGNGTNCVTLPCGDGGLATAAQLNFPTGVTLNSGGDIYIADAFDNAVRKVTASTGTIQTVAGTLGTPGFSGDGAPATSALLNTPFGVALDTSNDIYIADSDNAAVREVVSATGFIQTIAGTPTTAGFSGDGGAATSATLNFPSGLFLNSAGKLFVADTNNARIRQLAPAPLTVTVAPSTATVVLSALQQYTATVTGNPNPAVSWFVNGVAGGDATVGTISTTGLFQAPASVPTPATVTITAVSQVDNATSGSAQATIATPSTTVTVSVSTNPPVTQVYTGTVQPFLVTVTGTANTAVTWYAEGAQGGNATFGTIDASGNYTAPASVPNPSTIVIEAVSQADPTAIGTQSITIVAAPSAPQPTPQSVTGGGTANYSLSLNANTGSPSQPITLSCLQSSLPSGASCTFTPATITPSSSAVPFTLAVNVPSTSASIQEPRGLWSDPRIPFTLTPLAGLLLLSRRRDSLRRLPWLALLCILLLGLFACGGGGGSSTPPPVTYHIKIQGTTTAQPHPVTITTASLTVQ